MLPTTDELTLDPHPALARLRDRDPVAWVPALGAWLVTGYDLATRVLRDAGTFTVDDPRFTTALVTGPSMLSLDGAAHARHRAPFAHAFRPAALGDLTGFAAAEAARLTDALTTGRPAGQPGGGSAELRTGVAGPLAAAVMGRALGLDAVPPATLLAWYADITAAVAALTGPARPDATLTGSATTLTGPARPDTALTGSPAAGGTRPAVPDVRSFRELAAAVRAAVAAGHGSLLADAAAAGTPGGGALAPGETVANAAVLLFGGIDTTEGMILNALWHLLSHPERLHEIRNEPGRLPHAIEESLRLEPAAAVVDRYATADVRLGRAAIAAGDPVTVWIAGANRDPAVFADPDRYDPDRENAGRHLAFAHGPHYCLGAHLARAETTAAVRTLLDRLPGLRLDSEGPEPGSPGPGGPGPARTDPEQRGPEQRGPEQRGPEQRGPEQHDPEAGGAGPSGAPRGLVFRKPPALYVRWD